MCTGPDQHHSHTGGQFKPGAVQLPSSWQGIRVAQAAGSPVGLPWPPCINPSLRPSAHQVTTCALVAIRKRLEVGHADPKEEGGFGRIAYLADLVDSGYQGLFEEHGDAAWRMDSDANRVFTGRETVLNYRNSWLSALRSEALSTMDTGRRSIVDGC